MKRYIVIILTSIFLIGSMVIMLSSRQFKATYANSVCSLLGDINNDGVTNKSDAILIAKYVIDHDDTIMTSCANINNDNFIKMDDAMWIIRGKVISLSLSKESVTLDVGGSITLSAFVNPSTAVNKSVSWSSSNSNVATVSATGKVTALGSGTATITATSVVDNTKKALAKVIVNDVLPTGITLTEPSDISTYYINGVYNLIATVSPSNASDKSVTWTSSDNSIATVKNGMVTSKNAGTVVISAKTSNGKTASVTLNINNPYIKENNYPYEYEDGSAKLTIEKKIYTSTISSQTTYYYLTHLKITDYTRVHSAINNNGSSTEESCGKEVYKIDKNTGNSVYAGGNCGKVSVAASKEGAIFAVEGDYSLNGGHGCNGIKGSIRDGEYYFLSGNMVDLSTLKPSKIGYGYYSKKTGVMGPTSNLTSSTALAAITSGEVSDSFCFSTNLVVNGTYANNSYMTSTTAHRQANFVGYKDNGEFYFVVSEGAYATDSDYPSDGVSYGLLPKDRAQILIDLGCTYGVQLDGGQSVIVWFRGKKLQSQAVINTERDWLTDFVYFK